MRPVLGSLARPFLMAGHPYLGRGCGEQVLGKTAKIVDETAFGFRVLSHRVRKPADLLFRALAHVDHCRFKLRCFDVAETPKEAAALIHLSPRLPMILTPKNLRSHVSRAFFPGKYTDAKMWIKVTASDDSRYRFKVFYSIAYGDHIDLNDFETLSRLSETIVLNLFLKIPGILIERQSMRVKAGANADGMQHIG